MTNDAQEPLTDAGRLHLRREIMADGERYIIYYTFGDEDAPRAEGAEDV